MKISTQKLRNLIDKAGFNFTGFAKAVGVSKEAMRSYTDIGADVAPIHPDNLRRIAEKLGVALDELRVIESSQPKERPAHPKSSGIEIVAQFPGVPAVFDLPIAASGWEELTGQGSTVVNVQGRLIVVRVRGDSMEPRFKDGQMVMFNRLDPTEDSPVPGFDYFFVRNDTHGTFKRVEKADADGLTLKALNPKYKKRLTVSRDELVMVAEYKFIVSDAPDV